MIDTVAVYDVKDSWKHDISTHCHTQTTYTFYICSLNCHLHIVFHKQTKSLTRDSSRVSANLSLLGLMAKIKCSICSYQFNIWYAGHSSAHILIWFLAFGQGSEVYLTLTTGCLGIALQPSAAHPLHEQRNTILHEVPHPTLTLNLALAITLTLPLASPNPNPRKWVRSKTTL